MKSAYYTAVVTNTYRMAMDAYQHGGYVYRPEWMRELCSVSHREYATGYYFSNPHENANLASGTGYLREKAYLAVVTGVNATRREVACLQRNKLSVGDSVELVTPGRTGVPFPVLGLFDAECHPIQSTPHPQMPFILSLPPDFSPEQIHAGDILRAGD